MITNPANQTPLLAAPAVASWLRRHRLQLAATGAVPAIGAVSASAATSQQDQATERFFLLIN